MKKVKILGWEIPVIKVKNLRESADAAGQYLPVDKVIQLDADMPADEALGTLLHEMVHCLFQRGGLGQTRINHDLEEVICEQFAMIIMDNFTLKPRRK